MTYPTKKLGEVTILNPKKSEIKDRSDNSSVSFVPMPAVNERTQSVTELETRELGSVRKGYTYFKNGDVLFAKITPCMENGKVAIARDLQNGIGFGSTEFHIIRPTDQITSEWIVQIIGSLAFREEAEKHMHGAAGQQRVPVEFLAQYEIPVPPIAEQRKIVARIEKQFAKIDEAARLRAESQALTDQLLPAALHEIFSTAKSKGWEEKEIGRIAEIVTGKTPPTAKRHYYDGNILWAGPPDLDSGKYVFGTRKQITRQAIVDGTARVVPAGSVLVSCIGIIGKVSIASQETATNQQINAFIPDVKQVISDFLYYAIWAHQSEFEKRASRTTLPIINKSRCAEIKILLPPLAEQNNIVKKLDALAEQTRTLTALQSSQAADFKSLKQSVLAEAFV
ncbi:MAG: hypothetical protein RL681_241 [Candidatus Parcubacteria bacterium]|jgi:type I restriction enzyme S subunit